VREAIRAENLALEVYLMGDGQLGWDFLTRAESDPEAPRPDLVLLDLNLPKRSGFDILRRLRASEKLKHTPVLIVTSSESPSDLKAAADLGASYFRKPPSYEEFLKLGGVLRRLVEENHLE